MQASELSKRSELDKAGDEAMFEVLLREGVRRQSWDLVNQALALRENPKDEAVRRAVFSLFREHGQRWYEEDLAWITGNLVRNVESGKYMSWGELLYELREEIEGWMHDAPHEALIFAFGEVSSERIRCVHRTMQRNLAERLRAELGRDLEYACHAAYQEAQKEREDEDLDTLEG